MNAAEFVSHLGANAKPRKTPTGWQCRCPAHDDGKASLCVAQAADRVLIHCHAECAPEAVCAAAGLKISDLFTTNGKPQSNGKPQIVATYDYTDENGKLLSQAVRFEPKDFRQRRPDGNGGWEWKTADVRRVLYRLPEIIRDVKRGLPIVVCEGEKDVAALVALGFSATCNLGGAGKWRGDYSETLRGASVYVIADKDEPGRKHAQAVAASLHGKAEFVAVVELPDFNGRKVKDAHDFISAGATVADVQTIFDAAQAWTPTQPLDGKRYTNGASEYLAGDDEAGDNPTTNEAPQPPTAKRLSELARRTANDPSELLRDGYLCRGGGALWVAQTGIGKSVAEMQAAISWATGKPFFGIKPTRPLKSLIVQAENDDGDLAEFRDGIIAGLRLTPDEIELVEANVLFVREDSRTGLNLCRFTIEPLLAEHHPDILWLDPANSYLGGDVNSQEIVGGFLRNMLNPLLRKFGCAVIVVHHTTKPPKDKTDWTGGDFAYLGAGSAEFANWARAVMAIRSTKTSGVFEIVAGKRGSRIGWKDDAGATAYTRKIAHSGEPGLIYWRDPDTSEVEASEQARAQKTIADLLAHIPVGKPILKAVLLSKAQQGGIGLHKTRALLDEAIDAETLFVWKRKRPGTNAKQYVSRTPEPEATL
jgi:5S rRNA maturation endonuclease (ribonuclease M5)